MQQRAKFDRNELREAKSIIITPTRPITRIRVTWIDVRTIHELRALKNDSAQRQLETLDIVESIIMIDHHQVQISILITSITNTHLASNSLTS